MEISPRCPLLLSERGGEDTLRGQEIIISDFDEDSD